MINLDQPFNFRPWSSSNPESVEDERRPDSPTVLVTKSTTVLKRVSKNLLDVYRANNPDYSYDISQNPIRPLTKPCEPKFNSGYDNEHNNYILYVNDRLISPENQEYIVLDNLGEGTFGQVFKCRKRGGELCAVKIIKNKPAYFIQGLIEVKLLSKICRTLDKDNSHHIVRMIDFFVYRNHLIIVFELLSLNLYELIRKNSMQGFSLNLIRSFSKQILEALYLLDAANIIHCDMKPENILLVSDSVNIKVIDLGSACFEGATIYSYIQSRYYRSPEVLLGLPYGSEIDSWSMGCICAELFIGIPLFPGANEYEQLFRITQLLGEIPQHMIHAGKFRDKYYILEDRHYRLKTREEYQKSMGVTLAPYKKYTDISSLEDLMRFERRLLGEDAEQQLRASFIDFIRGLLALDPFVRWSAQQAMLHPFIQGTADLAFHPPPKIIKKHSLPAGALKGSCPSLLERIRSSQDASARDGEVSYRPCIEELSDDYFKGFAHGKLYQIAHNQPVPQTFPNPPFYNPVPSNPYAEMAFQPVMRFPPPNIMGPRYRPHSYEPGAYKKIPRPKTPKLEEFKLMAKTSDKKNRSSSYNSQSHHQPKVVHGKTHSSEEEKPRPRSPGYDRRHLKTPLPEPIKKILDVCPPVTERAASSMPSNFLAKVKKQQEQNT